MLPARPVIKSIVFDLDGTLYVSQTFASEITAMTAAYIADFRDIGADEARRVLAETRAALSSERGSEQTLSAVCTELGGNIRELHRLFAERLRPEAYLQRDQRVIDLLYGLSERFKLYLYTNNNRSLTMRILHYLGIEGMFVRILAIDDQWLPKPDETMLEQVLAATGDSPAETLFVGDRYDIDLALPETKGCPVYLSRELEQLLRLEELLG
jgi:putative hydrolase of the HAD superfamily